MPDMTHPPNFGKMDNFSVFLNNDLAAGADKIGRDHQTADKIGTM